MESSGELLTNIYTLHEPNGEIRYVGKTILPIRLRLSRHISNAQKGTRSYCASWLRSLAKRGLEPEIRLLQVISGDKWADAEKYWISYFRQNGCRLVNLSDGGDGAPGYKHRPDSIAKMVASSTGFRHSEESRAKMSAAARARPIHSGWNHTEETKARLSQIALERDPQISKQKGIKSRVVNPLDISPEREYIRPKTWREAIGAANQGEQNGQAKLTFSSVAEIKGLLVAGQLTQREIAERFNVSRELVGMIQRNRRWRHVPWPEVVA